MIRSKPQFKRTKNLKIAAARREYWSKFPAYKKRLYFIALAKKKSALMTKKQRHKHAMKMLKAKFEKQKIIFELTGSVSLNPNAYVKGKI